MLLLSQVLPLVPSWAFVAAPLLLLFAWFIMVDADLTTFVSGLRGVDPAQLRDQVVWVLGASSGIGEELAVQMAAAGAKVVLSARREDELQRVARRCVGAHPPMVLPLDVLELSAHAGAVSAIVARHGSLHWAVLNVGRTQRALAECTEIAVTRQLLELNVIAQISLTRAVLPTFLAARSGRLLVTSSVAGKIGSPASSSYSASKFALQGYYDALRLEVADRDVKVCVACPGPVATAIETAAFTDTAGQVKGSAAESLEKKMPAARCAQLMLAAATRDVDECWISRNPVLLFTYLAQYCPDLTRAIGKRWIGPMRTRAFREGRDIYGFSQMAASAIATAAKDE